MVKDSGKDDKAVALVAELLTTLTTAKSVDERKTAATELAGIVKAAGVFKGLKTYGITDKLKKAAEDKKNPVAREAAMVTYGAIAEALGRSGEPYMLQALPVVLNALGDKVVPVRAAADVAAKALLSHAAPYCLKNFVPVLLEQLTNEKKWQTKVGALQVLSSFAATAPTQIAACLPEIVPSVSDCMWDTKPEVGEAATACLTETTATIANIDIIPFLPALVSCIARPQEVPETVHKLSSTTFVQQVEAPTLAIMLPVLNRGLSERAPAILRQCAVIIDNMCKLVEDPADAHQFVPKLMPGLERVAEIAADPELRQVAENAMKTLKKAGGTASTAEFSAEHETMDAVFNVVKEQVKKASPSTKIDEFVNTTLKYVSGNVLALFLARVLEAEEWTSTYVKPYLINFISADAADNIIKALIPYYTELDRIRESKKFKEEEEEDGEVLCDCEFSLAYGGMILLNNTKFRLIRGSRYGLCGPNGCGKTTLMRAIANGQVENFPPPDVLKTVFVEHNLQAEEADFPVLDFISNDEKVKEVCDKKAVEKTLRSVGFDDDRISQPVGSLSGGWKMKLELARAMILNADIMLLDEPTNHLDVANVNWLVNYLINLKTVTCMIVSHDSGFLDRVCTHIIHYENRKLKTYKGNLSKFVEAVPEAKSYYSLEAATIKFKFPEPGFLEGVKSKDKAILKMSKVGFTYPGATKQSLFDISLQCSLNSRVAVVGPNGAGKSTMIKCLTGEVEPQEGEVYKHPNLRIAYVAQHAFHHIEQHLDKTANEYIRWRYAYGEDRELLAKATRQMTEDDEKQMAKVLNIEGVKYVMEDIVGRRKAKRSYEYEIKWIGKPWDDNIWMTREKLEAEGYQKILQAYDDKEAARAGMYIRPLTQKNVEQQLEDCGLPAEFGTHSRMRGLSGGQKVKVVLAAAMWFNPHMLIMDEPTNFLDRDSLGALAGAIKDYGGGVLLITHNQEFASHICPEQWHVDQGRLTITGAKESSTKEKIELKEETTRVDAFGNVEKVKSKRKLTRKELKLKETKKKIAKKEGIEYVDSDEEDD
ncbi:translational elongation factor EF-1 alpha [Phlyctochytrium planicorne]|nr:translational elongation factor EF-1 alpha [Phlyctochytrium planicorne]